MSLLELFCSVDDFCVEYAKAGRGEQIRCGQARRERKGDMHLSEMMTLLIHFHQSHYRDFNSIAKYNNGFGRTFAWGISDNSRAYWQTR